jgi:hypothetical protein
MGKVVVSIVVLMAVTMFATPVMAIGPWQAEEVGNNQQLHAVEESWKVVVLDAPNVDNQWNDYGVESDNVWRSADREQYLSASNAKINNAVLGSFGLFMSMATDPEVALEYENKWIFLTYYGFMGFLLAAGFSEFEAEQIASQYPDGVYYRYINVGQ